MTVLAVALAWWAMAGAAPPSCLHVQLAELRPPVLGRAQVGGCQAWIARRLLPARTRSQTLRLCWSVVHELGHTIGLTHSAGGIMARVYRPGHEPGACWNLRPPITCVVCHDPTTSPAIPATTTDRVAAAHSTSRNPPRNQQLAPARHRRTRSTHA